MAACIFFDANFKSPQLNLYTMLLLYVILLYNLLLLMFNTKTFLKKNKPTTKSKVVKSKQKYFFHIMHMATEYTGQIKNSEQI